MEPYQERVIAEEKELRERVNKLNIFINSEDFPKLAKEDQLLLVKQLAYMEAYGSTLCTRISMFRLGY